MVHDDQQAVSIPQAARMLGVSRTTLKRELRSGNVPHRKFGNRVLIPISWVHEMTGHVPAREISLAEAVAVLRAAVRGNAEVHRAMRELGDLPIRRR
jgi:excisionase family DNA binding protein